MAGESMIPAAEQVGEETRREAYAPGTASPPRIVDGLVVTDTPSSTQIQSLRRARRGRGQACMHSLLHQRKGLPHQQGYCGLPKRHPRKLL
jgi:hypothetical protein